MNYLIIFILLYILNVPYIYFIIYTTLYFDSTINSIDNKCYYLFTFHIDYFI